MRILETPPAQLPSTSYFWRVESTMFPQNSICQHPIQAINIIHQVQSHETASTIEKKEHPPKNKITKSEYDPCVSQLNPHVFLVIIEEWTKNCACTYIHIFIYNICLCIQSFMYSFIIYAFIYLFIYLKKNTHSFSTSPELHQLHTLGRPYLVDTPSMESTKFSEHPGDSFGCPKVPKGLVGYSPKDSVWEDWGILGKIRGITTRDP